MSRFTDLPVYSGHNALGDLGRPADGIETVVWVGGQVPAVADLFAACRTVGTLDNGVKEQGVPIAVCSGPRLPWSELWQRVRHLD